MSLVSEVLMPPEWTKQALCAEVDYEIFFPNKGDRTVDAKRICRSCNVKQECLEYSFKNNERFGIWGGLTEFDRKKLRRKLSKKAS